jgi:hypothetical protein
MKHGLILLSLSILSILIILAIFLSKVNLTGFFTKPLQNENITDEIKQEEEFVTTEKTLQFLFHAMIIIQ